MSEKEKQDRLRSIERIKEKLRKLERAVERKVISEKTFFYFKSLKEEVFGLAWDFEFKLDIDFRLFEEEFDQNYIDD